MVASPRASPGRAEERAGGEAAGGETWASKRYTLWLEDRGVSMEKVFLVPGEQGRLAVVAAQDADVSVRPPNPLRVAFVTHRTTTLIVMGVGILS